MYYRVKLSKRAQRDREIVERTHLGERVEKLLRILSENPYQTPPPYEKLIGNLKGFYSRRINLHHRLIYEVREEDKSVVVLSMWTHYE